MIRKIIIVLLIISTSCFVYATDDVLNNVSKELDLNMLLNTLQEYTEDKVDISDLADGLISGEGTNYGIIGDYILNNLLLEIRIGTKSFVLILIVVVLMAIIQSLELEKDSTLSHVTSLVGFLVIVTIILESYFTMAEVFIDTIMLFTQIVEVVAPFLLAILIATGEIATSGIIGPVLLFITSLIGALTSYIIIPLLSLSLIFKIITNMSEKIKLNRLSNLFSSTSMWVVSVVFALFLGVLELEGSITTSIDEVTLKTTQTAISNLIPVVGKFVSDSMEVVMGASEVIGKAVGIIGIIVLIIVALVPIIKLVEYSILYFLISCFSEMFNVDSKITNLAEAMSKQYKIMTGIMVGAMVTYIIGFAIIINLMGRIGS